MLFRSVSQSRYADEDMFKKEEWWHKERIIEFAELLASEADIAVLKVLYG